MAVSNADVSRVPGRSGAVDDVSVSDDDVERLGRERCCSRGECEQDSADHETTVYLAGVGNRNTTASSRTISKAVSKSENGIHADGIRACDERNILPSFRRSGVSPIAS